MGVRQDDQALQVQVQGQFVFDTPPRMVRAALGGFGLAYVPGDLVLEHVGEGRLVRVLENWCPANSEYHLYYPSRHQPSAAFALIVDALRYRG